MVLNDLQLALLGVGAVVVLAVWAYNRWQLARLRQRTETLLPATEKDALAAAPPPRSEPTLGDGRGEQAVELEGGKDRPGAATAGEPTAPPPLPREWAEEAIDCVARLRFAAPVASAELLAMRDPWLSRLSKSTQWLGWEKEKAQWAILDAAATGFVDELAVALQLADRRGALEEAELSAFIAGLTTMAQRFAGHALLPDAAATLARARRLDAFCGEVDLQFGLRLLPLADGDDFAGAEVLDWLRKTNLVEEGERHLALTENGAELFSLFGLDAQGRRVALTQGRLAALVFTLDVPRIADGPAAFDALLACARQAAQHLCGRIADGHGRPLPETSIAASRARIIELQAKMAAQGIPAGSPRALRLFA